MPPTVLAPAGGPSSEPSSDSTSISSCGPARRKSASASSSGSRSCSLPRGGRTQHGGRTVGAVLRGRDQAEERAVPDHLDVQPVELGLVDVDQTGSRGRRADHSSEPQPVRTEVGDVARPSEDLVGQVQASLAGPDRPARSALAGSRVEELDRGQVAVGRHAPRELDEGRRSRRRTGPNRRPPGRRRRAPPTSWRRPRPPGSAWPRRRSGARHRPGPWTCCPRSGPGRAREGCGRRASGPG